ncbi:MAG TPA: hypothetical protein PK384_12160, partial [Candidatus Latescibacteria bacterium]|nr:hypothetical protein [Candidatus Latescibacterota bacterium]
QPDPPASRIRLPGGFFALRCTGGSMPHDPVEQVFDVHDASPVLMDDVRMAEETKRVSGGV